MKDISGLREVKIRIQYTTAYVYSGGKGKKRLCSSICKGSCTSPSAANGKAAVSFDFLLNANLREIR